MSKTQQKRFRVRPVKAGVDLRTVAWELQVKKPLGWMTVRSFRQQPGDDDYTELFDIGEEIPRSEYSYAHLRAIECMELLAQD